MRIWSRAWASAANARSAAAAADMSRRVHGASKGGLDQPKPILRNGQRGFYERSMTVRDSRPSAEAVGSRTEKVLPAPGALSICEMPLVAPQDVLDDREAQAGAAQAPGAAGLDAVEALGQPRQMLLGDARPLVVDRRPARQRGPPPAPKPAGAAASAAARMRTGLPSPPYLIALSTRLTKS